MVERRATAPSRVDGNWSPCGWSATERSGPSEMYAAKHWWMLPLSASGSMGRLTLTHMSRDGGRGAGEASRGSGGGSQ